MSSLAERFKGKFPNIVTEVLDLKGTPAIVVKKEGVRDVMFSLKHDPEFGFNFLMDLSAVDYLFWEEKEYRFEVIYNLYSSLKNQRLFVKALVPEADPVMDSVAEFWASANWYEREVWDMFGVRFNGHPNLKRILMYEEFKGHPLRKDYRYNQRQPLIGPLN